MGPATKIAENLHIVKLRTVGGTAGVTLPAEVREKVRFFQNAGFIAIRPVGHAVILVQVTDGTPDGIVQQSAELIDQAMQAWAAQRAAESNGNGGNASAEKTAVEKPR